MHVFQDKIDILKEESELLRSLRDQLTERNANLQDENSQLLQSKNKLELQQAVSLYKAHKLKFDVACYEAEKLSSTILEDIFTLDTEIYSTNESILVVNYFVFNFLALNW